LSPKTAEADLPQASYERALRVRVEAVGSKESLRAVAGQPLVDSRRDSQRAVAPPGATFAAALQIAERAPEGNVILAMLPDTGERYLSTVLFEGVETGSDAL
jgi:cysteine synthase